MKKVLLLAAAVLTLGTATARLGLEGTLGKSVKTTFQKVFDVKKADLSKEAKTRRIALAGSALDRKMTAQSVKPAFNGIAAPMMQMAAENLQLAPAKAEVAKKIAAKAPAAIQQTYTGNGLYYQNSKWNTASPWKMHTASVDGTDYMFDVIPDLAGFGAQLSYFANGVYVEYTSTDNGNGTTAISVAPQYIASTADYDIFLCDRSNFMNGGDGSIKMTLAADGTLTIDNPTNVVGYFATPIDANADETVLPPFVGGNIAGAFEQCGMVTYTIPVADNFVAEKEYTGKGCDYESGEYQTWTMQTGKKDGADVIRDIVPSISEDTGSPLDVVYTVNGNNITIQPQKVGEIVLGTTTYYLYICSSATSDFSISLTKDDQGHIIAPEDLRITIGAYTTDAFPGNFTSVSSGGTYAGYWQITDNVQYYAEDQDIPNPAPTVMYEPAYTGLFTGMSTNGYTYNATFGFLPGYAEIPYVNTTGDQATSWAWEVCDSTYDATTKSYIAGTPVTGTDKNFSFMTEGYKTFGAPVLTGTNNELVSAPYNWGIGNRMYQSVGGGADDSDTDSQGGIFAVGVCNPGFQYAYYSALGTPDVNANRLDISTIYMYMGKPAAPLYITGLNLLVRNFTAQPGFSLTARIVKATRSTSGRVTYGETIAYADASAESVVTGSNSVAQINFNDMYVLDEDEMSQGIDYLFLDQEFAVIIDEWNNGTFSCYPYGEYDYNANGYTNVHFEQASEPGSLYSFTNMYNHLAMNFNDGTYGFLHTTGATDFTALAAGGEETIHVDDAMLRSVKDGNYSPRVFLSDDCPEWITVSTANSDADGVNFDIKLNIAENDGEAREAKFYVYQEGAKIDITVKQADANGTGIAGVTVDEASASAPRYNVAGQRVNAAAKGIVISNGKKQITK